MRRCGSALRRMVQPKQCAISFVGATPTTSQARRRLGSRVQGKSRRSEAKPSGATSKALKLLQDGLNFEKKKGFINFQGNTASFSAFLVRQVDVLSEAVAGQEENFQKFSKWARVYNEMHVNQRKQLVHELHDFISCLEESSGPQQHMKPVHIELPPKTNHKKGSDESEFPMGAFRRDLHGEVPTPAPLRQTEHGNGTAASSDWARKTVETHAATTNFPTSSKGGTSSWGQPPSPQKKKAFEKRISAQWIQPQVQSMRESEPLPPEQPSMGGKADGRERTNSKDLPKVKLDGSMISKGRVIIEDPSVVALGLDTETNGLSGAILEISVCNYNTGEIWTTLINHGNISLDKRAYDVHGISKEALEAPGVPTPGRAYEQLVAWIHNQEREGKKTVIISYNGIQFDYPKVLKEVRAEGLDFDPEWLYLDGLVLVRQFNLKRKLRLENSRLVTVQKGLGIADQGTAHRADADTLVLGYVVRELLRRSPLNEGTLLDLVSNDNAYCGSFGDFNSSSRTGSKVILPVGPPKQLSSGHKDRSTAVPSVAWEPDPAALVENSSDNGFKPRTHIYPASRSYPINNRLEFNDRCIRSLLTGTVENADFWTPTERKKLIKAGFHSVLQVAHYFPRDYSAFGSDLSVESKGTLVGVLVDIHNQAIRSTARSLIVFSSYGLTRDGRKVSWTQFYRGNKGKFLAGKLMEKHPDGSTVVVRGKLKSVSQISGNIVLEQPISVLLAAEGASVETIVPVYPARTPLKPESFRADEQGIFPALLKELRRCDPEADFLPQGLKKTHSLAGWRDSLLGMHAPREKDDPGILQRRFAFQDLFFLQLLQLAKRYMITKQSQDLGICISKYKMMNAGKKVLGFELTPGQEQALKEILADLTKSVPMLRLLQGDVGSGKTVVALLAMLAAVGSGYQVAMMAPSTVLAQQHFKTVGKIISKMPPNMRPEIALLSGYIKGAERKEVLAGLESGAIDVLIGTHAVYGQKVAFKNLAFIAIDEQHKFGVQQRETLHKNSDSSPHVLLMSATPIPRTLALTIHGSQLVSSLNDMLPGRKPVTTEVVNEESKEDMQAVFADARKEIANGGRVFVVFSIIEESQSDVMAHVKSVEQEFETMKRDKVFGDHGIALLHGRMPKERKIEAMESFADGKTPVLISTTVIEVGVDIPEASMMIVNNAERYGLAQLHQLRGRVGRGDRQSKCVLLTKGGADAMERLLVLEQSMDGQSIAEEDLRIRGPGDLLGSKQHGHQGLFSVSAKDLLSDRELVESARRAAAELLATNDHQIPREIEALIVAQGFPPPEEFDLQ